jgi:glutamine synthetase
MESGIEALAGRLGGGPSAVGRGLTSLGFVDVNGCLRGKAFSAAAFDSICRRGHSTFTDLLLAVDPVDEPITTFEDFGIRSGAADLRLRPLPDTLIELPWRPGARLCLGDLEWPDGTPCELSSRRVLAAALDRLEALGLRVVAAFEYEARLHAADGEPVTPAQSYSLAGVERAARFADRLHAACEVLGLGLSAIHTEAGPGLVEINVDPRPGLEAADGAVLLREAVREVARECGLRASLLAKPASGQEGSSGHVHVSLWKDGANVLADGGAPGAAMRHAIGGILRHMPAMSLLMNPTINSYKRLVPGFFAPVNASWGVENRSAAVRAIPAEDPSQTRIEVRRPGADANPYLALAAILASIASGIESELDPPPALQGDVSVLPARAVAPLPASLEAAIGCFRADDRAQELLGRRFSDYFVCTREWELRAWQQAVSDWERQRYALIT